LEIPSAREERASEIAAYVRFAPDRRRIHVPKAHTVLISLLLAAAVVSGAFAAVRTTSLGAQRSSVSGKSIAARQQRLDNVDAQLRHALAQRPPVLPATLSASSGITPRVKYVRAPSALSSVASDEHGDAYGEDEGYEDESDD
jgi:hypothetical protein